MLKAFAICSKSKNGRQFSASSSIISIKTALLLRSTSSKYCSTSSATKQRQTVSSNLYEQLAKQSLCGPPLVDSVFANPNRHNLQEMPTKMARREQTEHPDLLLMNSTAKEEEVEAKEEVEAVQQQPAAASSAHQSQPEQRNEVKPDESMVKAMQEKVEKWTKIFKTQPDPANEQLQAEQQRMQEQLQAEQQKMQEEQNTRFREASFRNAKYGLIFVSLIGGIVVSYLLYYFFYAEPNMPEQYTGQPLARLWRFRDYLASYVSFITEPPRDKLLPDPVKPPWHQPKYTVVLEMRNVLVNPEWSYKTGHYFVKRPALDYFMDVVGYPNFELVIYTSENMTTAAPVVAQIDGKGHHVNHALFRDCTKYKGQAHIKDLSKLNRDLSKVIYIDWEPAAFQLNPENVLRVPKWKGDMSDTYLVDLAELLKTIHLSDVEDVRPVLQFYSQFDNPMAEFRRRAQMLGQQEAQKVPKPQSSSEGGDSGTGTGGSSPTSTQSQLKKYGGSLFGARRHAV